MENILQYIKKYDIIYSHEIIHVYTICEVCTYITSVIHHMSVHAYAS